MEVQGRDEPVVQADLNEDGSLDLRVDFRLRLDGWCRIRISKHELRTLLDGHLPDGMK